MNDHPGESLEHVPPPERLISDAPLEPTATPRKRPMRRLLAALGAVLAITAAVNVTVDPDGVWGTGLLAPDPQNERAQKEFRLEEFGPFSTLLVGDSRCQLVMPQEVERLTGSPTFNGCISGGTLPAEVDLMEQAIEQRPGEIKHLVWMANLEMFRFDAPLVDLPHNVERALSFSQLEKSVSVVAQELGLVTLDSQADYARDGHQLRAEGIGDGTGAPPVPPTRDAIVGRVGDYSAFWQYAKDDQRRTEFDDALAYLNEHDLEPVFVLMPYQPWLLEAAGEQWTTAHSDFVRYLRELKQRRRFTLVDLSNVESFGGDPLDFYDPSHLGPENSSRLLQEIVRRAEDAL